MLAMMFAALSFTACSSDDDEIGISSFLVGTWAVTSSNGWLYEIFDDYYDSDFSDGPIPEYTQFKSDGTYVDVQLDNGLYISKGTWRATDTELVLKETEGRIKGTYTYTIVNHSKTSMTVETLGLTSTLTKVPDSTIEKYLK